MSRKMTALFLCALVVALSAGVSYPCGIAITFRAYLDKRFWQPLSRYEESLGLFPWREEPKQSPPFAGMSDGEDHGALQPARQSYQAMNLTEAKAATQEALLGDLTEMEREEALLIDAKIDLREGESGDEVALRRAGSKLRDFLQISKVPAYKSEARGWLARVHYLTGDYSSAAKIYLDELSAADSVFSRKSLVQSLRMLFPYNGGSSRLADHLEEYFDTPAHALFVVNLVTNPVYSDKEERASMARTAAKTIEALQRHQELFTSGDRSDALALALMRAAMYMGDIPAALSYSGKIREESKTADQPEFNWMKAACLFLQHDYAAAEAPLLKMRDSKDANYRDRSAAAQGLIGVYEKLGRGTDQLHAAFLRCRAEQDLESADIFGAERLSDVSGPYGGFLYWPAAGRLFDLPYLLDVQLKDEELAEYLKRYSNDCGSIFPNILNRRRSACEMVQYALAVRYARREKYSKAAAIYEKLNARPRAERMRALSRLHAEANNPSLSTGRRLEAQYAYADFLERHSTQVFFNDMLWSGFQTWAFLGDQSGSVDNHDSYPPPTNHQGLTREERERFLKLERKVRDEQEERWRAYKIFTVVMQKAAGSELGERARAGALKCLRLINTGRFGREEEIHSAIGRIEEFKRRGKTARKAS